MRWAGGASVIFIGFSLHAAVRWAADQRQQLEHLCRYITRPAIANQRLNVTAPAKVCCN
jgi:hypothetical protein